MLLAIGTGKGLFLARGIDSRTSWQLDGPQFPMDMVYAIAIDTRGDKPRLLVSATSEHWGPSVFHSDDLGATWQEPDHGAVRFPEDTGASLARVWQLEPAPADRPGVVWAGSEPASLFRSEDGGATFELLRGLWDHPHRPQWEPGGGGLCLHTIVPH
ncbi:MAG: WD40/YVTN/BNR-like repeat-containing protein, partial [Acidimicrobiales bacterium]